MDSLSPKIRLFVEAYDGNVVEAMQVAGFVGDTIVLNRRGNEILQNELVKIAIRERSKYLNKTTEVIANREERQALWSALMRNQDPHRVIEYDDHGIARKALPIPFNIRMKATELLGKSENDFVEQINITGQLTVTEIITQAYEIPDSELDAIEAEYEEIHNKKKQIESAPIEPEKKSSMADFI